MKFANSVARDIYFYAFWRLYYVNGQRLVQRKKEKFVAINGSGWPAHAKRTHEATRKPAKPRKRPELENGGRTPRAAHAPEGRAKFKLLRASTHGRPTRST